MRSMMIFCAMICAAQMGVAADVVIAGGDLPFPLKEKEGVKPEIWESSDSTKEAKIVVDDEGDSYMILKDLRTGKIEILRKVK